MRGQAGPASFAALVLEDDREFLAERVSILVAEGVPEAEAMRRAVERMNRTRDMRRALLVANVERVR